MLVKKQISFPLPTLARNESLYITAGGSGGIEGIIFVVIMTVFEEGVKEGRIAGMYYALKDGPAISAEQLNFELMDSNDKRLWDFMRSE